MDKRLKAIIVDDERLARAELRSLLGEHPNVEVAGEAHCIDAAIELCTTLNPSLVFLDVQLQGENGFELLDRIDSSCKVIFVTAYDTYAIRAFEVNAIDYLLKPVNPERLKHSIDRLQLGDSAQEPNKQRKLEYEDSLFLTFGERLCFLPVADIRRLHACGDYSEVFTTDGRKTLVLRSLRDWEARLPERFFVRIHRSTIINLKAVEKIEEWFNGSYLIHLAGTKEPQAVSRRYAAKLRDRFR
jgi:two-component system LytT family response regulator